MWVIESEKWYKPTKFKDDITLLQKLQGLFSRQTRPENGNLVSLCFCEFKKSLNNLHECSKNDLLNI